MSFSQILIKYSGNTAEPTDLAVGELAYSDYSGKLFIGTGTGVVHIGGAEVLARLVAIEDYNIPAIRSELNTAMADIGLARGDIQALLTTAIPALEAQLLDHVGRIEALESLVGGTGTATFDQVVINGDLIVNGTTTTVNSTVTSLTDPVIRLGSDTDAADGLDRGVSFQHFDVVSGAVKTGFFGMDGTDGKFKFVGDATETGSNVFDGAAGIIVAEVEGNASTATKLAAAVDVALSGEVTGSASFDGASATTIVVTVDADSEAVAEKLVRRDASGGAKFGDVVAGSIIASGDVQGQSLGLVGSASMQNANLAGNLSSVGANSMIVGFTINGGSF